jgi:hypothetical protein
MEGRMECSTEHGDCVPDVQCNGSEQATPATPKSGNNGVPPPPDLPASE